MNKPQTAARVDTLPEVTGQELTQEIYVTDKFGAYTTNRVRGHSASSTSGAPEAAERLAGKLFGPSLRQVAEVDPGNRFVRLFRATADPVSLAWTWATGLIEVGEAGAQVPDGALELARGPKRALVERLAVVARHGQGKSKGKLLVPGIPEAVSQKEGADALEAFLVWAALTTNTDRDNCGVMFYPYLADRVEHLHERVNERRAKGGLTLIFSPQLKGALERDHRRAVQAKAAA